MARELAAALSPRLGLQRALTEWETIARGLCDPPRRRKRQLLS